MQRPHTSGLDRRQFVTAASGAAIATAFGIRQSMASPSARYPVPNVLRGQDIGNLPTPRNQTIVVEETLNNIWDSFNPFIANGENGGYGLIQTCREALFYANFLTGEVRPWLATGYSYNADFSECTLKLNPAAAWSDGKPYTADDIVFSQTLLLENTTLNGSSDAQADLTAIKAADPHTVVFSLKQPSARFHYRFIAGISVDNLRVVPKHIWEGKDPGTFAFNPPVYTGPFQLQEASSSKLYYLWKKNPHYWNKANLDPKAEYVLYRQASSVDAAVQEFLAGNLDVAHQGAGFDYLNQQVVETQTDKTTRFDFPDPCPRGVYFNSDSPSGLFSKPEGRWAMSHLLDREAIGKTIWQPASRPATFPWADYESWKKWATPEVIKKYDFSYDTGKAGALLDGLGAAKNGDKRALNGKPLQLTMITPVATNGLEYQIGDTFARSMQEAGIDVTLKSLPGSAFGDSFMTGDYDLTCHWLCGMQFDPNQLYAGFHSRNYFPIGKRANRGGDAGGARFKAADYDAIVEKLDVANPEDPAARPLFDQGLDTYLKYLPAMPIIQTIYPMMFNTAVWKGWPTPENPYTVPASWWSHFMFAICNLEPAQS